MIFFFYGTDRAKARTAMQKAAQSAAGKNGEIVRITDAHSFADLQAALSGGGMFAKGSRIVVLDGVFDNEEMTVFLLSRINDLSERPEKIMIYHNAPAAVLRKTIEKYAEKTEKFDAPKSVKRGDIFVMAHALSSGDKKALWVGYQRALARHEAPEAIHGVLFWGAKQMALSGQPGKSERGKRFVAELAELPHEARRKGFDLEYALEKYILGVNKN